MKKVLINLTSILLVGMVVLSGGIQVRSQVFAATTPKAADELLIKYKPGVSPETIAGKHKGKVVKKIEKLRLSKVKIPPGASLDGEILKYKSDLEVEYVQPNYRYDTDLIPNDPSYNLQWGTTKVQAEQGWDVTNGNTVTVAIVDTGVDNDHPDLINNLVPGYNAINNSSVTNDDNGHGTHVAGIAAGTLGNGIGIAGVAGGSKIMPIKVLGASGSGFDSDISEGIVWAADNGAKVINMSLGANVYSQAMADAVEYAYSKGVVIVAAAGNSNTSALTYPASFNHVIAVAAVNENSAKASFSNFGTWVDIAAPGTNIYSTTFDGSYGIKQGTSMAAPFVAGAAALVIARNPGSTPGQVENSLETSTTDLGQVGKDSIFGYGLLNVGKAVNQVIDTSPIGIKLIGVTPNPFGPTGSNYTKLSYSLAESGKVTLTVKDGSGSIVKTLLNNSPVTLGSKTAMWNGKNDAGLLVPEGTYSFSVQVIDSAGNISTPMLQPFIIDRTPPVISGLGFNMSLFVPNGTNSTNITYTVSESSKVSAGIYNSRKVLVKTLLSSAVQNPGLYTLVWNGKNNSNLLVPDDTYTIKVNAIDTAGWRATEQSATVVVDCRNPSLTNISAGPNPFRITGSMYASFKFTLSETSVVSLQIKDNNGNSVRTLANATLAPGTKVYTWDGRNSMGSLVPDGTYTYVINATDSLGKQSGDIVGTINTDKTPPEVSGLGVSANPFTPILGNPLTISYSVSEKTKTTVCVYNSSNVIVKTLETNLLNDGGLRVITWDGKNNYGLKVTNGIYSIKVKVIDLAGFSTMVSTAVIVQ